MNVDMTTMITKVLSLPVTAIPYCFSWLSSRCAISPCELFPEGKAHLRRYHMPLLALGIEEVERRLIC